MSAAALRIPKFLAGPGPGVGSANNRARCRAMTSLGGEAEPLSTTITSNEDGSRAWQSRLARQNSRLSSWLRCGMTTEIWGVFGDIEAARPG